MAMRVSLWSIVLPVALFLPENITFQRKRQFQNMSVSQSVSPAIMQTSYWQGEACVLNFVVKRRMVTKGQLVSETW
jgi:hypothetical protein